MPAARPPAARRSAAALLRTPTGRAYRELPGVLTISPSSSTSPNVLDHAVYLLEADLDQVRLDDGRKEGLQLNQHRPI